MAEMVEQKVAVMVGHSGRALGEGDGLWGGSLYISKRSYRCSYWNGESPNKERGIEGEKRGIKEGSDRAESCT